MGPCNMGVWPGLSLGLSGPLVVFDLGFLISKYGGNPERSCSLLSPSPHSSVQNPYPYCYETQHSPGVGILEQPAFPSSEVYSRINRNVFTEVGYQLQYTYNERGIHSWENCEAISRVSPTFAPFMNVKHSEGLGDRYPLLLDNWVLKLPCKNKR